MFREGSRIRDEYRAFAGLWEARLGLYWDSERPQSDFAGSELGATFQIRPGQELGQPGVTDVSFSPGALVEYTLDDGQLAIHHVLKREELSGGLHLGPLTWQGPGRLGLEVWDDFGPVSGGFVLPRIWVKVETKKWWWFADRYEGFVEDANLTWDWESGRAAIDLTGIGDGVLASWLTPGRKIRVSLVVEKTFAGVTDSWAPESLVQRVPDAVNP
ncbi:MAG: hypothetical protein AAB425_07605 [Bdellovibrionota bacterium]